MNKREPSLWQVQHYTILATTCGEIYGESGLGLHAEIDFWVTGISGGRRWDVDHLKSGRRIASFNAQARARVFIEEIAPYTDWTQPYETLLLLEELRGQLTRAIRFAEEWKPEVAKKLLQMRRQASFWNEDDTL